jgi:hypothetical protein
MKQEVKQKFINFFRQPVKKINEVLVRRVKELGGNQAEIARKIGFKSQTFGNYLKGRKLPLELIEAWKRVYKEDLQDLADEINVSRETNQRSFRDEIFEGDYIGMHKRVYDQLEENYATNRELLRQAMETIRSLANARNS